MRAKIEFDDQMVQRAFVAMDPKTFRTAVKSGMRRSLNIIKRRVVANYKAAYPGSQRFRGIHMKVYRTGTGAMIDLIYLKSDKELRSYVLRFQNKGTAMRVTKEGWDRGFMPASDFFGKGIEQSYNQADASLARNVDEAIIKKARKEGFNV